MGDGTHRPSAPPPPPVDDGYVRHAMEPSAAALALALGTHARKLWHLHLDCALGPGGAHDAARGHLPAAEWKDGRLTKAAHDAAAVAQHCLRWVVAGAEGARGGVDA